MSLIVLDRDGNELTTLPYQAPPNTIMWDGRLFDYEATQDDEHIYRERTYPEHSHEMQE